MHHNLLRLSCYVGTTLAVVVGTATVEAQTERAAQRRIDRNERQTQRQASRSDYYPPATWQQLDPWIRQSGVVPYSGAVIPAEAAAATQSAARNAVRQSVDAVTRIGDGQFGFREQSPQTAWFYDYYTVSPTYYVPQGEDRYANAIRYFDSDNDGVFESQSFYRDSDNDGRYDEYDQLDFYQTPTQQSNVEVTARTEAPQSAVNWGPEDSKRYRMTGEIALTKQAKVNGNDHLVVALKESTQTKTDEQSMAIDLGPAEQLKGKQVEVGAKIIAHGALQQVGEKRLLVADTVQIANGEPIRVGRSYGQSYTGEIVDIKTITIDTAEHYMAVVNINGESQLVDLGPTTSYKAALKPATKITIQGVPVRSSAHRIILADQIRMGNNEVVRIERSRKF